jgi:hypothetical protein
MSHLMKKGMIVVMQCGMRNIEKMCVSILSTQQRVEVVCANVKSLVLPNHHGPPPPTQPLVVFAVRTISCRYLWSPDGLCTTLAETQHRNQIMDASAAKRSRNSSSAPGGARLEGDDSGARRRRSIRRAGTLGIGAYGPRDSDADRDDTIYKKSFRLADLDINEKTIFSGLDCHLRFKVKEGYEMRDLPKFNDLALYDVSEEQEMYLWKLEVRRLVEAVELEGPVLLEGPEEWYGSAGSEGYNRLHVLATAMKHALDICVHDNELVMLEHRPTMMAGDTFALSYRNLMRNFDPDEGTVRFDKQLKLASHNDEAYHALINYLTATMARVLVRTIRGEFWAENCLSTLAKFATKLKVLAHDLPAAVSRTIEAQNDLNARLGQSSSTMNNLLARVTDAGKGKDEDEDIAMEDNSGARYFNVVYMFNAGITTMLSGCAAQLRWDEEVEQTADLFETSTVIYHTGFRHSRTMLCQERDGAIAAGSTRNMILCAGAIFDVCRETWSALPSTETPVGDRTTLVWNWTPINREDDPGDSEPRRKTWTTMRDVIGCLVPYSMLCGYVPSGIAGFARAAIDISDPTNPAKFFPQKPCLTAARLRTSQYEEKRGSSGARTNPNPPRFQNVYDTPMAVEGALAGIECDTPDAQAEALRQRFRDTRKKYEKAVAEVQKWAFNDGTVTITSLWYSYIVLAIVGILVCGGVGFIAVQDRIGGVDPSNLTVLVWTAAGVLMIYFKSRRVENWPWRDFLQGRVVCRSVSELHAVSKIDEQVLLAVLMRFEVQVILNKCGPYRGLFDRKDGGGFSIDVPPLNETARHGGHIFIGVDTAQGPALVDLEAYSRAPLTTVELRDSRKTGETYICRDFLDPAMYNTGSPKAEKGGEDGKIASSGSLPLYHICTNAISWNRIKGVFVERSYFC